MMRAVIAVVAVLVVVGRIVVMQQRGQATTGDKTPGSASSQGQVQIVRAETHVIECHDPDYLEDNTRTKKAT